MFALLVGMAPQLCLVATLSLFAGTHNSSTNGEHPIAAPVMIKIQTLDGKTIEREFAHLSEQDIRVQIAGKDQIIPFKEIRDVGFGKNAPKESNETFEIELSDGSVFYASSFVVRGKKVEIGKPPLVIEFSQLRSIHRDHLNEKVIAYWREEREKSQKEDKIIAMREGRPNGIGGVIVDGTSEKIAFKYNGNVIPVFLANIHGLSLSPTENQRARPEVGTLLDDKGNVLKFASVSQRGDKLKVLTASGVEFEIPIHSLMALDFRRGNVVPLSKIKAIVTYPKEKDLTEQSLYRDDGKNWEGKAIKLGGQEFSSAISIHAPTKVEYVLDQPYKTFQATLGVDGEGFVGKTKGRFVIQLDNDKEQTFDVSSDGKPVTVAIPVTGKKRLTIKVVSQEKGGLAELGVGAHGSMGDPELAK